MSQSTFSRSGNIIDIVGRRIFRGTVTVSGGRILSVKEEEVEADCYILPGLVDAHVHIESSMLIPSGFARLAVSHGTVATVSDPHEIANVMGIEGVEFMISNGKKVPFKFYFGAPSCVPATTFETAGARLGLEEIEKLLRKEEIGYLSEMMNFPGVLHGDAEVTAKLSLANKYGKPVDGHAPGLKGEDAKRYIAAGISTDHECFTIEEAEEKIRYGMKILIREGSAARNLDALMGLLASHPDKVMFCSDDKHPDDLVRQHMDAVVRRCISKGYDLIDVLRACIYNPARHYRLDVGMLQPGDPADMVIIDEPARFNVSETFIDGILVARNGEVLIGPVSETPLNNFNARSISTGDLRLEPAGTELKVIEALEGQLITHRLTNKTMLQDGNVVSDPTNDVLKMVVLNRYEPALPAMAFVRGFGLKRGAIASSVAHDSHNIIAVGATDKDIVTAVNHIIDHKGGICVAEGDGTEIIPLPFAGIMSNQDGTLLAAAYQQLDEKARELGSTLHAPFMTLSFMALLVIPDLKLSDRGLFDGRDFSLTSLFC